MSTVEEKSVNSKRTNKRSKKPSQIRIGKRYRANRLNGPYDAIVIGSGIGGLTTARSLAAMGKKVLVLEQHYTAGGFTHAYSREGYEWDVGVHYIGDVGYPTMSRKLFDFISDGNLKWAAMDKAYDRIFLGNESYDLLAGKDAFAAELKAHFPNEHQAIEQYLEMIKKANNAVRLFTLNKLLSPTAQKIFAPLIKRFQPKYFNLPTYDVLKTITQNEKLIAVLTGQWGDSGVTPKKGSFLIHSLIARHYQNGGYYPIGGASKIAETIIPQIQQAGGDVLTYAKVSQLIIKNDRVAGVKMADGTAIPCNTVISNAGVFNTFEKLVPPSISAKFGYAKNLTKIKRSCANVGLFIGLKDTAENLNLPKTNFWVYLDENHDQNVDAFLKDSQQPLPVVYISFPSAKDPSWNARYPGRATIEIVAPAGFDLFSRWQGSQWGKRGEDYEALSQAFADRMLAVLYQKLPQLKGKIDYYEASSPLSTEYFCEYQQGEIYGLEHDPSRFEQHWLKPKTKIPGLWLTGQDILSCGVAGAMIAGLVTAIKILGIRKGLQLAKLALAEKDEPKEGWAVYPESYHQYEKERG